MGPLAIMRYFEYAHLPEHLQRISKEFHTLAWFIHGSVPDFDIAERVTALRKLLEAKDCAVRASLPIKPGPSSPPDTD